MLKRNITYEDFNGDTVTETFYFNLSRTELINLEVEMDGGLKRFLERIVEEEDAKALIEQFQKIVLLSYGERSADGKRFIKNDELREAFTQTAAYDALFMELATDANAAADFVTGIIPANLVGGDQDKPVVNTPPIPESIPPAQPPTE